MRVSGIICLCAIAVLAGTSTVSGYDFKLPGDTPLVSFKNKPSVFLTLDKTSSFVGGKSATTNEIKFGLDFKKKLKLGIGFAKLVSDIVVSKQAVTANTYSDTLVSAQLFLSFISFNSEYVFYDSKRWQVAMPVSMGIGSSYFSYFEGIDGGYKEKKLDEGGVVVFTAAGVATYRVFRWVGLSGGAGYRLSAISNSKVEESFNSPVYVLKIRIFLGEIYKTIFPRGISGKHDPPYSNEYWD